MTDWTVADWANVVSIAGIVGTWITIVLVYFTLREMKNQRLAAQKPDIVIIKTPFAGYISSSLEANRLLIGRSTGKEAVKFYNVGFGVAKNIRVRWMVKYDKTIEQIKEYCYSNSIPIVLQLRGDWLTVTEQGHTFASLTLSDETHNHNYLMPVSVTSEGLTFGIPSPLRVLVSLVMYVRGHYGRKYPQYPEEEPLEKLNIDIPSIQVEVNFDDVEDTHYSRKFDVAFFPSFWGVAEDRPTSGSKEMWAGSFEFTTAGSSNKIVEWLNESITDTNSRSDQ